MRYIEYKGYNGFPCSSIGRTSCSEIQDFWQFALKNKLPPRLPAKNWGTSIPQAGNMGSCTGPPMSQLTALISDLLVILGSGFLF